VKTKFLIAGALVAVALAGGAAFFLLQPHKATVSRPAPGVATATGTVQQPAAAPAVAPADCLLPGPPPVPPDGGAASAADMKLAHDVIQAYVLQLEAYQACRNEEVDHAPIGTSVERKQIWLEEGNAAVDQAHAIADAYAAQMKRFKQHHP
jgi:hypothetical protein